MIEKQKLNELKAVQLRPVLPSEGLNFALTDELDGDPGWLGQDRAVDAIRMGALAAHEDISGAHESEMAEVFEDARTALEAACCPLVI
ncbi:hypothetical protein KUW17_21790 [Leisingera aquaemixtae]|uniref:hypothetical protein n=1 Tax=Leisingera aquaemixtae TaxID=1396826 RepID=UPI001C969448|nr:hypothetical protein [Leisingera aquaemixtae]MBY6069391.1 hypothetical protein [Leisingera aquaemixtae]